MKYLLLLLFSVLLNTISAQTYGLDWALVAQDTSISSSGVEVYGQESNDQGETFIYGTFRFRADIDPSGNSEVLTANGHGHLGSLFIAKYDALGDFLWAKDFGGQACEVTAIDFDNTGNIFLTGWFHGYFNYDPVVHGAYIKSTAANGNSNVNGFILKFNGIGEYEWIKRIECNSILKPTDIGVTAQGKIVVTGDFRHQAYFSNLTQSDTISTSWIASKDAFLVQYDKNGEYEWAFSYGGSGDDNGYAVESDSVGGIYVLSELEDTVDIDPSNNVFEVVQGPLFSQSYYLALDGANTIAKYDSTGSFVWGNLYQDVGGYVRMRDIKINSQNQIGVVGVYTNDNTQSFDFDFGAGSAFINGTTSQGSYVALYDTTSALISVDKVGTDYYQVTKFAFNSVDDIYTVGRIRNFLSPYKFNGFLCKNSASGGALFAKVIECDDEIITANVTVNALEEPIITSFYEGLADLDPSSNTHYVYASSVFAGGRLSFMANYSVNGDFQNGARIGRFSFSIANTHELDDYATNIVTDFEGSTIVRGYLEGVSDFDPTSNNQLFKKGCFFVKYDSLANYKWGFTLDSIMLNGGIAVDSSGNSYIAATSIGVTDLDPSPSVAILSSQSASSGLVAKYDSNGNYLWGFPLENMTSTSSVSPQKIVVDSSDNILVFGYYKGSVDFDPSASQHILTSPAATYGSWRKSFIVKYDSNGSLLWVKDFGILEEGYFDIAVNNNDDIFITGSFEQDIDIDPSSTSFILNSTTNSNILLVKYNSSGNLQWGFALGDAGENRGRSLVVGANHVYLTGSYSGSCDFDPVPGASNTTVLNGGTTFIARYKSLDGALDWVIDHEGAFSIPRGIDINDEENIVFTGVFFTGWFASEFPDFMDVDPSPDTVALVSSYSISNGIGAVYTVVYDSLGTLKWVVNMEESSDISIYGFSSFNLVRYDNKGNIVISGEIYYDADFVPREAEKVLKVRNGSEFFLARYSVCTSTSASETITACESYQWHGNTYTSSGVFNDTISNYRGCDSLLTLNLTILLPDSATETLIECDSLTWSNGITYTNSGTYYNYLTNSMGCDSIVTLDLTIITGDSTIENVTVCDNYTWSDGVNYNSSGIYYQNLTNSFGCDSTIILDLTIQSVDTGVTTLNDSTLFANAVGANYQWFNCQTLQPVAGAVNQTFTTQTSGLFAVEIESGLCIDTSACYDLFLTSEIESYLLSKISVYPNPTSNALTIDLGSNFKTIDLQFVDVNGRVLIAREYSQSEMINLNLDYNSGVYILILESEGERVQHRVVIKN
ncbi:T9SS type A sorting domain-containing protein [Brumimicrobium mesophilum]|uniref:T9SS type A sorting domain-containing protein n=1 Tax=Brumimicrobium mesophilum TaxID=392717 RepID=UPI00131DBAA2|nr:T9SS type A sorting domain-containing protein [Brumimicrobium mesophilum]